MESAGGRPKRGHEARTKQVRMDDDLADKVGWIVRVKGETTAQYLARLTRAVIEADYERYRATIERLQALEKEHQERAAEIRKAADEPAAPPRLPRHPPVVGPDAPPARPAAPQPARPAALGRHPPRRRRRAAGRRGEVFGRRGRHRREGVPAPDRRRPRRRPRPAAGAHPFSTLPTGREATGGDGCGGGPPETEAKTLVRQGGGNWIRFFSEVFPG